MIDNPITWPHGKRCAVAITFDMDSDSFLHLENPTRAHTMLATTSYLRYDRIAVPRIIKMFERHGIRQTFFVPGWCAERYPDTVKQIIDAGHEVAHHGYLHEHPNALSPVEEEYVFRKGIEALERVTGTKPKGFRAPMYNFSPNTARYLSREEFTYDSSLQGDDIPYLLEGSEGEELVELPTDWALDDWPHFMHNPDLNYSMPIKAPNEAMNVYMSHFEAAREFGALWIAVWHPFLSGRLARISRIDSMIQEMLEHDDVWFAPLEDIAAHVKAETEAGRFSPRREPVPTYEAQIPETQ